MNILTLIALSKSISTKNSLVVLSIAILIIVFIIYSNKEFYVSSQEKIKTLENLYELKSKGGLDSATLIYINTLNFQIIHEHSVQEYVTDYFISIFNPNIKSFFSDSRNQFLQFLTSSYLWILCIFAIPFTKSNTKSVIIKEVYVDIRTFFILLIIAVANCFVFDLIPIVYHPCINYLINFLLQIVELYILLGLRKKILEKIS